MQRVVHTMLKITFKGTLNKTITNINEPYEEQGPLEETSAEP